MHVVKQIVACILAPLEESKQPRQKAAFGSQPKARELVSAAVVAKQLNMRNAQDNDLEAEEAKGSMKAQMLPLEVQHLDKDPSPEIVSEREQKDAPNSGLHSKAQPVQMDKAIN